MGTIGHLANGNTDVSKRQQHRPAPIAYTNGDSSEYKDNTRISHGTGGDPAESRPVSQGVASATSSGQSRPATSQGTSAAAASSAMAMTSYTLGRPGSTGTDVASPPAMRHGFAEAYSSEEYLTMLEQVSRLL